MLTFVIEFVKQSKVGIFYLLFQHNTQCNILFLHEFDENNGSILTEFDRKDIIEA